jgi:hypothetical protein
LNPGTDPLPAPTLAGARRYLLGRQSPGGGFCVYRSELLDEPNLFDTWHGVAALGLLGVPVPDARRCARFVAAQAVEHQARALYYRVRSLLALQCPDPLAQKVRAAVAELSAPLPDAGAPSQIAGALQALRHVVWLKRHFGCDCPLEDIAAALRRLEDGAGGFPTPPDLATTHAAWAVLRLCDQAPSPRSIDFVAALAVPGFGFRLTANSLSPNLETTCAGIRCCRWSDQRVVYASDAADFILACQSGRGGFSRAPDALPDLYCTHLALEGLSLLCGPLGPAGDGA